MECLLRQYYATQRPIRQTNHFLQINQLHKQIEMLLYVNVCRGYPNALGLDPISPQSCMKFSLCTFVYAVPQAICLAILASIYITVCHCSHANCI